MNHGIYFSEIFVLQHTDQNPTKNELIVYSNIFLRENDKFVIKTVCK